MGSQVNREDFEDILEVSDALERLEALLPKGLKALPANMLKLLSRDDYSGALKLANELYGKERIKQLDTVLCYIILLNHRGLHEEARNILRKAMVQWQDARVLQLVQLDALLVSGQEKAALDLLEALEYAQLKEPRHWGFMGDCHVDFGHIERAVFCYRQAFAYESKDSELAFKLARLLHERGELFDAAMFMERSARLGVSEPHMWSLSGDAWMELDEYERAAQAYGRVVKLEVDDEGAWLRYGLALSQAGNNQAARRALERALELDPFLNSGWTALGYIQLDMGYAEEAFQSFSESLVESPKDLDATLGLVASSFDMGDYVRAQKIALQATMDHPDVSETHYSLGVVLLELHRFDKALLVLERAQELAPQDARIAMALAQVLVFTNAFDRARAMVHCAHELGGDDPEAVARLVMILLNRHLFDEVVMWLTTYDSEKVVAWSIFEPLVRVAMSMVTGSDDGATYRMAFERSCEEHEDILPLGWDFEHLDGFAFRLPRDDQRILDAMLRRVELG